ncbi:serine protease [Mesorhizobium sp. WSM3860]|nr:serine protease [Mesorhizobium sp. WSM3860]
MTNLYSSRHYLSLDAQKETGLRMPVQVYFKDPRVAELYKDIGIDTDFNTPWEPGLRDGPTSARFVVVDYDSTSNTLAPSAVWDSSNNRYIAPNGTPLDGKAIALPQFHQLSVWAIVQNTLDFFESGFGLGRRISWAFEGNRLIILPHAGYGENAYYDRASKSLQFYWFGEGKERIYTCLSSDIVNHEFGHAILDGLRPYFYESIGAEAAGFHEFLGDLTAILMAFRNNSFRRHVLEESKGNLDAATLLAGLAQQFGEAVSDAPYLRSALSSETMKSMAGNLEPHALSEVLTGAMFDILKGVFAKQREAELERFQAGSIKQPSDRAALAHTVPRMQSLAIQPLDLLPPCSVTFRDYALAVLRAEQVANPTDPKGYRSMMIDKFIGRGILAEEEREALLAPTPVFKRPQLDVFHSVDAIAASRGGAYRFLDDNRAKLLIPLNADILVTDVVRASKRTPDLRSMPDQIVVQYIWREELRLEGERFGRFNGERTTMLCGATMVLDQNGNRIHWARKPGTVSVGKGAEALAEQANGAKRREELLGTIAARIKSGMIGELIAGELGMLARASPPFGARNVDGIIRFELAPHFSISEHAESHNTGDRQWQISF